MSRERLNDDSFQRYTHGSTVVVLVSFCRRRRRRLADHPIRLEGSGLFAHRRGRCMGTMGSCAPHSYGTSAVVGGLFGGVQVGQS